MLPVSTLKRFGSNDFCGMVISKAAPSNWSKPTLLLRMLEKNGSSVAFIVTGGAYDAFSQCELGRIYELKFPGTCVKNSKGVSRFGVNSAVEVFLAFPVSMKLASTSFPRLFPYNFVPYSDLNQKADGDFVDILGEVSEIPELDANASLPSLKITLVNGNHDVQVTLLAEHSGTRIVKGDVVAFSGLKITQWNEKRSLQSTFLSVIDVNPADRSDMDFTIARADGSRKRKAFTLGQNMIPITVAKAVEESNELLRQQDTANAISSKSFLIHAQVKPLTAAFFDEDVPITETTKGDIMCYKTEITDKSGNVAVKLWNDACYSLFGVTSSRLQQLWEEGVEHENRRTHVLEILNRNTSNNVALLCKAEVWTPYGAKSAVVNINVNSIEILVDDHSD